MFADTTASRLEQQAAVPLSSWCTLTWLGNCGYFGDQFEPRYWAPHSRCCYWNPLIKVWQTLRNWVSVVRSFLYFKILAIGLVNFVLVDCCDQMNRQFLCKLHLNDHQTCRQPLQAYLSSSPPFILSVFSWYSLSIFPDLAPSERASMVIDCQIVIAKTSLAPSFLPFSRLFLKPPPCAS